MQHKNYSDGFSSRSVCTANERWGLLRIIISKKAVHILNLPKNVYKMTVKCDGIPSDNNDSSRFLW